MTESYMNAFEFAVLALTFLFCLSVVWGSFRAGITPVPSSRKARRIMLEQAELAPDGTMIELGSGWGHLALSLARRFPQRKVIGYELSVLPWLTSLILKQLLGVHNLTLYRNNFLDQKLPDATLAVCYLYPEGMNKLAAKLRQENPQIDVLLSNTFALPGTEPEQIIRIDDLYRSPIYIYRLKKG